MAARGLPPGPRPPRGLLSAVHYVWNPLANVRAFYGRYGPVSRAWFPGFGLMIYVSEPELVKQVFGGDPSVYHAGEAAAQVLGPGVGPNSVLTLDERPHLRQRKLLLPPFHGENVRRWEETIREITERDIQSWPVGQAFALRTRTQRITLEVILRAVFGVRQQDRFERALALVDAFARRAHPIILFPFLRRDLGPWSPWPRFKRARAALDEFLYEEIALRRAEADLEERDDVLSLLLRATDEDGQPMTDQELRDELVTVIGAGHETTATAVAWAFERLLRNPSVLDRLEQSLPEGDEYLEATIKETLRIRPVLVDLARRLTQDIDLAGYRIPAGALVLPSIAAIHFREDLYPEPDQFQPERFLASARQDDPGADHSAEAGGRAGGKAESYTWIPFGGGVRRCIGASFAQFEMRVMIRAILEHAVLRTANPRPERAKLRNITIAPARGCHVVLERRLPGPRAGERVAAATA